MINSPTFKGYQRIDGSIGIRNHVLIISTVACANYVAERIARDYLDVIPVTHQYGCDQIGKDLDLFFNTLLRISMNGNIAAVLVIGLGCEEISASFLAETISKKGKPVDYLIIQNTGGTSDSIIEGKKKLENLRKLLDPKKSEISFDKLIIGLKCGGSDFSSGIISNPAVGVTVDLLLQNGARVIFGETTELLGAEEVIKERSETAEIERFILKKLNKIEEVAARMKVDIRGAQPSPGNIEGGLSTIEEKSLGAICKIGSSKINHVLNYGQSCSKPGLSFMDTPGNDILTITGFVAGGAQVIIFTTGRGTPMGFATVPVIKICASPRTVSVMEENIDVNLSPLFSNQISLSEAGKMIFQFFCNVIEGKLTKAELLGHSEFGIYSIGPIL
jgi:altronate dehydratase large subunit